MKNRATIDFEGRSACDLRKHGSWRYAKHETTEVMCLAYKLPHIPEIQLWHRAHPEYLIAESPPPVELFNFIAQGGEVEAHNAFFERMLWRHIMVPRYGWPEMPHLQWRCSAAKASASSLPRGLNDACKAMGLSIEKDMVGNRLMLKMCKPRKPRKAEREEWAAAWGKDTPMGHLWHEDEEDIYRQWDYCKSDVAAEIELSESIPDLSDDELAVWQMDQAMNEKGVRFDLDMAHAALYVATEWKKVLNQELEAMTGISAGSKRAQVKAWLEEHEELELPDTAATTLTWYIEREPISGRAQRVMEIMMDVNRTSTRKYQAMIDKCDPDDWCARDMLMYHGAGTGRWSSKSVQVHNFPARDLIVKDFEEAAECIKSRDVEWCQAMYGDVMKLLSHSLRGAIIPREGKHFMVADYSAIEARVVLWLADDKPALDVFLRGDDIYCDMASGIYGYPVIKKQHTSERQFGKQAILGLGYSMGFLTFLLTCRKYGIFFPRSDVIRIMGLEKLEKYEAWVRNYLCMDMDKGPITIDPASKRQAAKVKRRLVEEREKPAKIIHELALMKYVVDVYRNRYSAVKQMWTDQERAAIRAVQKGDRVECGKVTWFVEDDFLYCELPSKRRIAYRSPEVKLTRTSWGEAKPALRYMSVNGVTRKWERTATYGGKIVENITQAVARDIMANAMMLADEGAVYDTVMSVHDELVSEVDKDKGTVQDFEDLMSDIPEWAAGCPITAEAERMPRYKK